jgi:hypothetical protein
MPFVAFSQGESSISIYFGIQQFNTKIEKQSLYLKPASYAGGFWGMAFRSKINQNIALEIGYNNYRPTIVFDLSDYLTQKNDIDGIDRTESKISTIKNFYFSPIWAIKKVDRNKINASLKSRISISLIGSFMYSVSSNPVSYSSTSFVEKDSMILFLGISKEQTYAISKWRFSPQIELGYFLNKNFALDLRVGYITGKERIHDLEMTYSYKNVSANTGKVYVNGENFNLQIGLRYYLNL